MRDRALTGVRDFGRGDAVWVGGAALLAAFAGDLVGNPSMLRVLLAAVLLLVVVVAGMRAPRPLLVALPLWLMPLALIRRLLTGISSGGQMDPLLLVGPLALIVLTVAAFDRGAGRRPTLLSRLVLIYTGLVVLGAVNPLQGSLKAGVTSLIFFVPLLAFWVGRGLVDDKLLRKVLILIGVLGIPAALYGLNQTFGSFPSWDKNWIAAQGYTALNVSGAIRPFSTFSNAAEYATFLSIAMVAWLRLGPKRWARPIGLAVVALLAVATFFEASRSPIVMLVGSLAVMVAAARRFPLWAAALLGALLLIAIPATVAAIAPSATGTQQTSADATATSTLTQHQVQGLSNPFDSSSSTAGFHIKLVITGVESAFTHPAGYGISSVTIAGAKFGGTNANTEADPSNAGTALGLPGLVVFLLIFGSGFGSAYKLARRGEPLAGVAVGILTVTIFQWLNGGQYSVVFLPWLLLGWVDRKLLGEEEPERAPLEEEQPAPAPVRPAPRLRRLPRPSTLWQPARTPPPAEEQRAPARIPPRRWHIERLEALAGIGEEQRLVLLYLRSFAGADGWLDIHWDSLVRLEFGPLLAGYDYGP